MPDKRGRYYLGRVKKAGQLNNDRLMDAIIKSRTIREGKFNWTFTDAVDERNDEILPYVFGHLSKYLAEGQITVVATKSRQQEQKPIPDLLVASAPFVYLPEVSGIAYLHVWNQIGEETFTRRFKSIVEATYDNFFVDCGIEPVSDYRVFSSRIQALDVINELSAKVHPPNPLFGKLWLPLKEYLKKRNASEVMIRESDSSANGLKTDVSNLMKKVLEKPDFEPKAPPDIGDAALLMAADGYGTGKVVGMKDGEEVVVRTSDTQKNFTFAKDPIPGELANRAAKHFNRVSDERGLKH